MTKRATVPPPSRRLDPEESRLRCDAVIAALRTLFASAKQNADHRAGAALERRRSS